MSNITPSHQPTANSDHIGLDLSMATVSQKQAFQEFQNLFKNADKSMLDSFFSKSANTQEKTATTYEIGSSIISFANLCDPVIKRSFDQAFLYMDEEMLREDVLLAREYMEMETRTQAAHRSHSHRFPTSIWHCCKSLCFATIASDPKQCMLLDELIQIHEHANRFHRDAEDCDCLLG